jgi:hypothetical protein
MSRPSTLPAGITGMHMTDTSHHSDRLRRRNVNFALALLMAAMSVIFVFDFDGNVKIMWRDAPLAATFFALAAVFFAARWWRTPRS